MSKQIPILFSTAMVQAIMDGRKTVTRRVFKLKCPLGNKCAITSPNEELIELEAGELKREGTINYRSTGGLSGPYKCPYGKVGDVLYVRETYYQRGSWREVPNVRTKGGRQKWEFVPADDNILFEAPAEYRKGRHHKDPYTVAWHKRLPRFMPKKYARIWLKVTDEEVQRIIDITEEDALAEGIQRYIEEDGRPRYRDYMADAIGYGDPAVDYPTVGLAKTSFFTLWESINGSASWCDNPWVWVVRFEVMSTTGKPENID